MTFGPTIFSRRENLSIQRDLPRNFKLRDGCATSNLLSRMFYATAHNPAILISVNRTKKDDTKEEAPCPKAVATGRPGFDARCHQIPSEYVLIKSVGPKILWTESRVLETGEYFPPLQSHSKIVEMEIGGVAVYRPFGEFCRVNSYCHISAGFVTKDNLFRFRCSPVSSCVAPFQTEEAMGGRQGQYT
ncbi:uncharacterized protein TNCV_130681 [Trichonephila clavipes]|nr:uncharacterized protein TNCV_130681 [Trichonephila clavipes]